MSESKYVDEQEKVICQVCGKSYWTITPQHLRFHNVTMNEYKIKFPDAPIVSKISIQKSSVTHKARFSKLKIFINSEKPKVDEVITDNDIDLNSISIQEELIENKKNEIVELELLKKGLKDINDPELFDKELDPYNTTPKQKLELLRNLKLIYPNLKNNYSIEKLTPSGHLEYKFITDMADPSAKTVIDFPNTFWRNIDVPPNPMKYDILKRDGWKVIIVKEVGPNMKVMRKYIDYIIE